MDKVEKISLIGLGAIGAAYAAKLHDMDPDSLRIIADQDRIDRYSESGFIVNGRSYQFNYINPETETKPADLVLVAVKYEGLEQAIKNIRRHVGPHTIIISLMNGISSEDMIASVYGSQNVLHAMCVEIDAVRVGTNIQFSTFGRICFGEPVNTTHSRHVQLVKQLFERANIPYEIPENMLRTMWWKFMINVGVNQTSAVLRAPYGVFQEVKEARELMFGAMEEVVVLSEKVGVHLNRSDIENFDPILRKLSPEGKTSMLQDIEAGRKTEVEYLAGKVCELGAEHGVPTPINDLLFKMIRVLEQTYTKAHKRA